MKKKKILYLKATKISQIDALLVVFFISDDII